MHLPTSSVQKLIQPLNVNILDMILFLANCLQPPPATLSQMAVGAVRVWARNDAQFPLSIQIAGSGSL